MISWQVVVFAVVPLLALVSSLGYTLYSSYRLGDWRPLVFTVVLFAMATHQVNELATVLETNGTAAVTGFGEYPETVANLAASISVILILRLAAHERFLREQLTEQVEQERQLRQENERLNEFVSVVSHDLRNPLNVAQSRLTLARDRVADDDLDQVADALDRMGALIDDLLMLAREGERVGDLEPVAIDRFCEECWQNVQTGDVTLVTRSEQTIRVDPDRLKQLIENLVRNSVEHGGDVTVTVGSLDSESGFYVADDGPGIPEDKRDEVFDRGYSTAEGGTGFGLAIVEEIASAHGWDVSVTESADGGARFEISGVETVPKRQAPVQ